MSDPKASTQREGETTWQRRTHEFCAVLEESWRSHRLMPWLFRRAERTERVSHPLEALSSASLLPTPEFSRGAGLGLDGLARQWGEDIARGEIRACVERLAQSSAPSRTSSVERLARELYRLSQQTRAYDPRSTAILAPARRSLARSLELDPVADVSWIPGAGARAAVLGSFEGVPYIAAQDYDAQVFWVVDFARVGSWEFSGDIEALLTRAELLRDTLVPWGNTRVLATRISANSYATIAIEDRSAVQGLRVLPEEG